MPFRQIAEICVSTGDLRLSGDGSPPFSAGELTARVLLEDPMGQSAITEGLALESSALIHLPSLDFDSGELLRPRVSYFVGDGAVELRITDVSEIPNPELRVLLEEIAGDLQRDFGRDHPDDLARYARYGGLRILQRRIRQIEESVRKALADDHVSDDDYRALRRYPERLAKVEALASDVRATPEAERRARRVGRFDMPRPTIDRFVEHVGSTADDARNAITRLSGLLMSQQVVLTQKQSADAERFQRVITIVGAAILVPGLIAGVFGANVRIPGESRTAGFVAMLLFMFAGAVGSYAVFRAVETNAWSRWRDKRAFAWIGRLSDGRKLGALFGTATVGFVVGVAVLAACA